MVRSSHSIERLAAIGVFFAFLEKVLTWFAIRAGVGTELNPAVGTLLVTYGVGFGLLLAFVIQYLSARVLAASKSRFSFYVLSAFVAANIALCVWNGLILLRFHESFINSLWGV